MAAADRSEQIMAKASRHKDLLCQYQVMMDAIGQRCQRPEIAPST